MTDAELIEAGKVAWWSLGGKVEVVTMPRGGRARRVLVLKSRGCQVWAEGEKWLAWAWGGEVAEAATLGEACKAAHEMARGRAAR